MCTFLPQKVDDLFSRYSLRSNVQSQNSVGKCCSWSGEGLAVGPPPMVQPTQWLIRPWSSVYFTIHVTFFIGPATCSVSLFTEKKFTYYLQRSRRKITVSAIAQMSAGNFSVTSHTMMTRIRECNYVTLTWRSLWNRLIKVWLH